MGRGLAGVVLLSSLMIMAVNCAQRSRSHAIKDGPGQSPSPPVWPATFEASYTFSLPYVSTLQTHGLSFPVHMWVDADSQRMRVDVYGGMDRTVTLQDTSYLLYPRINRTVCDTIRDDVGPTAAGGTAAAAGGTAAAAGQHGLSKALLGSAPLPDISGWLYGGTTEIGNAPVHIWQLFDRQAGKTSTYTFYTTPEGTPVR
eukprot:GHRQ01005678.1.p1 GENE.GHRQ01005678.1~~GHRQ01005678.1.p1  ORF type:complete len:200 (+),score=73.28 GHRQ01005678.1:390-989(+)